jgi:hypothetical protein
MYYLIYIYKRKRIRFDKNHSYIAKVNVFEQKVDVVGFIKWHQTI